MARGSAIYTQSYNTLAAYKGWAQSVSNALNAAQTRTNDTGQVNWATIPSEPPGPSVRDYEVFALGGSLQATAPIFIRIDYSGGNAYPPLYVTVGTTTDGAGNLGGLLVAKTALVAHAISQQTNQWCWAACDNDSYFTFALNLDPATTGAEGVGIFVVERTRNLSGAATGAGFHAWRWYANTVSATLSAGGWSRTFGATLQPANADYNLNALIPDLFNTNTTFAGTTAYAYPVYTYTPPFVQGASKALLLAFQYDFPRGQPVTLTHYGQPMTFIPMGEAVTVNYPVLNTAGATVTKQTLSPLIRWD